MALVEHPTNPVSQAAIGAAIEVHRHLGPGLLESCYHACLCRELDLRGVEYRSEVVLPLVYKEIYIPKVYILDLLIEESLIIEIKSVEKLAPIHTAQLMTYLRLQKVASLFSARPGCSRTRRSKSSRESWLCKVAERRL